MAIKLPCPRCKRPLSVPNKKAGGYVQCPQCNGRLWVPKDAPADATHVEEVVAHGGGSPPAPPAGNSPAAVAPSPAVKNPVPLPPPASPDTLARVLTPAGTPAAAPAVPAPGTSPSPAFGQRSPASMSEPGRTGPEAAGRHAPAQNPPPAPAAPPVAAKPVVPYVVPSVAQPQPAGRKVAHFISAEAAQSTLKLAADGKLPELHLEEGEKKEKNESKQRSVNPVVLIVGLAVSVVMSILLAVSDLGPGGSAREQDKNAARRLIREKYYSDMERGSPVKPYQQLLRDADVAHVRRDFDEERRLYREVLDLLHAEGRAPGEGVTGSPDRDRELERWISILLSKN
jgi:DNA-directed RNA polymerase subunit RPC12/RpoP